MSKFEFMINLKIPQFLGLAVPNAVRPHRRIHRMAALFAAARIDAIRTKMANANVRRMPDIEDHVLPTWEEVAGGHYEPWDRGRLVLDTAISSLDHLVDRPAIGTSRRFTAAQRSGCAF